MEACGEYGVKSIEKVDGGYARGCIDGAVELAETGPTWQAMRLSRNRNWGHPETIDYLVDRRGGKRILRDVMNRHVPAALTDRPKRGFSPPLEDWLRGPLRHWVDDLLDPALMHAQGYFHPDGVKRIWQQHLSGWRNHSNLLWALLMFQSWLEANRNPAGRPD